MEWFHRFLRCVAFFALLMVTSSSCSSVVPRLSSPSAATRVINGTEVTPHSYPWIVNIRAATTHQIICTGIIYNEMYIITVARCIDTVLPQTLEVVVGEHNIAEVDGAEVQVKIAEVIPNELYQEVTHYDDIALLKLAEPLTWTPEIQPAVLATVPEEDPDLTDNCVVAGWGLTSVDGDNSPTLLASEMSLIDDADCRETYLGTALLGASMLCADSPDLKVPCGDGDDGAPLMCGDDGKVVGIFSWSEDCASAEFPPVFTQISYFLEWIQEHIEAQH